MPWCITLDNSNGISRLRFWAKNRRVNGINDLPVFMHQGTQDAGQTESSETSFRSRCDGFDAGDDSSTEMVVRACPEQAGLDGRAKDSYEL